MTHAGSQVLLLFSAILMCVVMWLLGSAVGEISS